MAEIQTPDFDPSFALEQTESFAETYGKAMAGQLDTLGMNDVPEGRYTGTILDVNVQNKMDKQGTVLPPNLVVQIRCEQYTTSVYMNTRFPFSILRFFAGMLGSLDQFPASKPATDMTLRDQVEYYGMLGEKVKGLPAEWSVRYTEREKGKFPNFNFSRAA